MKRCVALLQAIHEYPSIKEMPEIVTLYLQSSNNEQLLFNLCSWWLKPCN